MLKNYFKIAWRNILKHKGFSLINVAGLSLGIACFVLIAMFVTDELSYDKYNTKADRIYRVNSDILFAGVERSMALSSDPISITLKNDYPEVENYFRFYSSMGSRLVKKGNEYIQEHRVAHADSTLFDVFTLPAIVGNTKTALTEPNSVVITETVAKRYFGSPQLALGQMLETQDGENTVYKVTAVIEDVPKNSHFDFEFFFSMHNLEYQFGNYLSHNFYSYVLLREGVDYKAFNSKFDEVLMKYIIPQLNQYIQIDNLEDFEAKGNKLTYSLQPVTDIHLYSSRELEIMANGNIQYVYIFSATALFILLIACINFMNLTTARASGRAKEVGIRKVLGTERKSLIGQFLIESTLIVAIALVLALAFVWGLLGWFNTISGKELLFSALLDYKFIIFLVLLPFVVGIFAGIYPAFFLSAFKPIAVLKGRLTSGHKKNLFRNSLVVFQFATSIILIVGTIVIYQQLNHIQNANIGFNKDQVLLIDNSGIPTESRTALKNEIDALNEVKSSSFAGFLPVTNSSRSDTTFSTETVMTEDNGFNMQYWAVDYNYISNMEIEVIDGRDFSREFGTDSTAIILNESAVKLSGLKDPIGKQLYTFGGNREVVSYTIVGVVKDFNFESLRQNVGALSMRLGNNSWVSAFRVETSNIFSLVNTIEAKYKSFSSSIPFDYDFLDKEFENMYRQEQSIGKIAITFAILAIIIACLGLFGLATYIAEQRTKEIGIRKVLGASVPNIVTMLSTEFVKLVLVSFVIGAPLAWFLMNQWLEDFAYRISLSWWIFAVTVLISLCIALLTLSFRAIKAAIANPVKALRAE